MGEHLTVRTIAIRTLVFVLVSGFGLLLFNGSASASKGDPPTCRGKEATIWAKSDAGRTFKGTNGPDVIVTGMGDDTIYGYKASDLVCSKGGDDTVYGGAGIDRIYAGSGNDHAAGASGNDVLCGYGGRDALFGGPGSDWLSAGAGISFTDADAKGPADAAGYEEWVREGYIASYSNGSGKADVMTDGMVHEVGQKLAKRWHC